MKKVLLAVGLLAMASSVMAAGMSCDTLKGEIDAKIKAKGASGYSLEVVDKGTSTDAKVVGTCEAGAKEIVYKK